MTTNGTTDQYVVGVTEHRKAATGEHVKSGH